MKEGIVFAEDGDYWFIDPGTWERSQMTNVEAIRKPVWSPDGRYVIYSQDEGEPDGVPYLYIYDLSEGGVSFLAENACCAAWSPDGKRIFR